MGEQRISIPFSHTKILDVQCWSVFFFPDGSEKVNPWTTECLVQIGCSAIREVMPSSSYAESFPAMITNLRHQGDHLVKQQKQHIIVILIVYDSLGILYQNCASC